MGRLNDRVAFVTGAARGQGRAHCVRLAEEGADIIAIDIAGPVVGSLVEPATMEQLEETRGLVEKTGRRALFADVDVRDFDGMKNVVDQGVRRFGRLEKWLFRQVTATALPDGMQEPADVAATVAFLASDESRFMTGTMLQIGAGNQLM